MNSAKLSKKQNGLLSQLSAQGDGIEIRKRDISLKDIAALTAKTGDEYAIFTKGSRRFVKRGNNNNALLSESELINLANDGCSVGILILELVGLLYTLRMEIKM